MELAKEIDETRLGEMEALNWMVTYLKLAEDRGCFNKVERENVWKCVKKLQFTRRLVTI
jgi:hypothetical protein